MKTEFRIEEKGDSTEFIMSIEKYNKRDVSDDKYPNVIGTVQASREFGPVEYGFAFTIDMSYKGKPDQVTENFISLTPFMEVNEFEDLCREFGINIAYSYVRK